MEWKHECFEKQQQVRTQNCNLGSFKASTTTKRSAEDSAQRGEIKRPAIGQNFFHHHPVVAANESQHDEGQGGRARVGFFIQFGVPLRIYGLGRFYVSFVNLIAGSANSIANLVAF